MKHRRAKKKKRPISQQRQNTTAKKARRTRGARPYRRTRLRARTKARTTKVSGVAGVPETKLPISKATEIPAFGEKILRELGVKTAEEKTHAPAEEVQEPPKYAEKLKPPPEEKSPWLEVRPFIGQELRVTNYLPLIVAAHGMGGVWEFFMASGPDPAEIRTASFPKRVVRYFVKCPDETAKELARSILQTEGFVVGDSQLRFEGNRVLWAEPDLWLQYPFDAELELEAPYESTPLFPESMADLDVLGIRSFEQSIGVIKNLHSALLTGGAFRIAVKADRAGLYLRMPGASADGRAVGGALSRYASMFFSKLMQFGRPDGAEWERRRPQEVDQKAMQDIAKRASHLWFACDARAYGTQQQIQSITATLSFPTNRFKIFRCRRQPKRIDPSLQKRKSFLRRCAMLSILLFPPLLWLSGLWNPLNIPQDQILIWPIALALALLLFTCAVWRVRNTVAMTNNELSLLVSMPDKPETGQFYLAEGRSRTDIRDEREGVPPSPPAPEPHVKQQKGLTKLEIGNNHGG